MTALVLVLVLAQWQPLSPPLRPAGVASLGGVRGTGASLVCPGTDKATGFAVDGTLQCATDLGGASGAPTGALYLVAAADATLSAEVVVSPLTDDVVMVANGTTWEVKSLPSCSGASQRLTYATATNSFACTTDPAAYVLPAATASVLGGVKGTGSALTCAGTGKADGFAADGTLQCEADQDTTYGVFTSGAAGLAPASGGGTTNFLRADQTWAAPPGGGGGYATIQEDGTTLTARTVLNVAGAGATCADDTTRTTCTVPGGLTADPAACGVNQWVTDQSAAGVLSCAQPAFSNLSGSATVAQLPDATTGAKGIVQLAGQLAGTAGSPTVTGVTCTGCVGATQVAALDAGDTTTGTFGSALIPAATSSAKGGVIVPAADCNAATTAKVLYTASTNTFSCGTDSTSAGGGYATVQEEGTPLTQRATLNFIGTSITCADNAGSTRTDCTVSSSGGSAPAWASAIIATNGDGEPDDAMRNLQRAGNIAPTPTAWTVTVARVSFFRPLANITVNKIRFYGVGATTNVYRVAIYSYNVGAGTGTRLTAELPITTTANAWGSVGSALNLTLTANTLYFVAAAVNATGTTAGLAAVGTTTAATTGQIQTAPQSLPGNLDADGAYLTGYKAQFAVTAGALPATTPALAGSAVWTGGMPVFWLDNSNL